ncbi:MAG: hypothetical protein QXJ28_00905, partial [Candidatus Pacearchaeota archaeon]
KNISSIGDKITELDKDISKIREEKNIIDKEMKEIQMKIDERNKIETELAKTKILLHSKKDYLSIISKEIDSINLKIREASKDFSSKELEEIIKSLSEKKVHLDRINREIMELSIKMSSCNVKINEFNTLKQNIINLKSCPTCLQEVSESHKESIASQLDAQLSVINNQKIDLDNEKQKKEIILSTLSKEISRLESTKSNLEALKIKIQTLNEDKKKIEDLELQKRSISIDISILEEQIKTLGSSLSELKKYDEVIKVKKSNFDSIIYKEKSMEILKAELLKELQFENQEIVRIERELLEKNKIIKKMEYISELEDWINNQFLEVISFIEKNVMLKLRGEFSKLFSEWFNILVPDNLSVRLDDDFTPIIEQQDYEIDYSYLSGGERTAVALAYRLALNQTINSFLSEINTKGIVILDEPTDGFSQQQLDKMRDVFQELNVNQLILVSHDTKIESFVDNIIKLKKSSGVTYLSN